MSSPHARRHHAAYPASQKGPTMLSPIAKLILATADTLTASATLSSARLTIPELSEKSPGVWSCRLSGRGNEDAIDLRLTFGEGGLIEIRARATIWNPVDFEPAWKGVWSELTYRHGQPIRWRERPALDGRKWTLRHEDITIEKRQSVEDGNVMAQVIIVRRFEQPAAASVATIALTDLLGEAASVSCAAVPAGTLQRRMRAQPTPDQLRTRWIEPRQKSVDYPRVSREGPYCPRWPRGRQRSAPELPFGEGPLFFVSRFCTDILGPEATLRALEGAFDALATRSDWAPFKQTSCDTVRCHSDRWWYLGGGVMLHVFLKEHSGFGEITSTITIHGYHEMDGPPEQCIRATPDVHAVLQLVQAAGGLTRATPVPVV